jgi:hypothetical protein
MCRQTSVDVSPNPMNTNAIMIFISRDLFGYGLDR